MRIVIIEDDLLSAKFLEDELKAYDPEIEVVAIIDSVSESVRFFERENDITLVFMDIELSDGISLKIFEQCTINAPVVFVTAHEDYMTQAFTNNGIAYITKPLDRKSLHYAIRKYKWLKTHMSADIINIIRKAGLPKNKRTMIVARKGIEFCFIRTEQVAYFFSENYIVFAVDAEGKKYIVETANLATMMEELDETMFFRANRKFIVNVNYIKKYKTVDRVKLQLESSIPVNEDIIIGQENAKVFKKWVREL